MAVEAGADGGAAEREGVDRLECLVGAIDGAFELHCVAAELLAEPDRGGIHQVGAADLEDVVELLSLRCERGL